jgi:precorrin-6A/cobalt-precorrin-6A reductase
LIAKDTGSGRPPMSEKKRILILGGTSEAAALAERAVDMFGDDVEVISSLAGRLKKPKRVLCGTVRIGGFGGIQGLVDYLKQNAISLVIDATHPFAATISSNAYAACTQAEVQRFMLLREPWRLPGGYPWIEMDDLDQAAEVLPQFSQRAFLTIGVKGIPAFSNVSDVHFLVRLIAPPEEDLPLDDYEVVEGRPPFLLEDEQSLMEHHKIDTLITKHSGGKACEAKLVAARNLGVRIVLVKRPAVEPGIGTTTLDDALSWIKSQI